MTKDNILDNIFKGLGRLSAVGSLAGLSGLLTLTVALSATAVLGIAESVQAAAETAAETTEGIRQGLPGRRVGGGTRTSSASNYGAHLPLVALVPESMVSVTTAAYPTLLFNLPVSARSQNIEFVLYNSADELVYQSEFNVMGQSGIISVDLSSAAVSAEASPETSAARMMPLAVNETYKWYFSLVAEDRAQDISVDGWIQRVALEDWAQQQSLNSEVLAQLRDAVPLEQSRMLYQDAALWSDAALIVHELRQLSPEDPEVKIAWAQLLQFVGLNELSEVPVAKTIVRPMRE